MSDELFVQVPDAVLLDPNLTLSEYKLWCYLQYRYFLNHSRPITISYADIGQAIHMGHNTIPDACKGLTEHGYLDMTSGGLGPNGKKYANTYVPLQGHRPKEGDDIRVLARNPKEGDDRSKEGEHLSKQGGVRPKQGCLSYKERDKNSANPPPPTSSPKGESASSGCRSPEVESSLICSSGEPQASQEPACQPGGSPAVRDMLRMRRFARLNQAVEECTTVPGGWFIGRYGFVVAARALRRLRGGPMTSTQLNDACLDWILRMGLQDLVAAADLTFTLEYPPEWSGKRSPMAWFQDIWDSPKVQKYRQALEQREHPVAQAPVVEEVPVSDF